MKSEFNSCATFVVVNFCPSVRILNIRCEHASDSTLPSVSPWTNQIAVFESLIPASSLSVGVSPPLNLATSNAGQLIIAAWNKFGYAINILVVMYPPAEHPDTTTFSGSMSYAFITSLISL